LCTRIDGRQDRGGADAAETCHEGQPLERALHLTADKLKERHQIDRVEMWAARGRVLRRALTRPEASIATVLNRFPAVDATARDVRGRLISAELASPEE